MSKSPARLTSTAPAPLLQRMHIGWSLASEVNQLTVLSKIYLDVEAVAARADFRGLGVVAGPAHGVLDQVRADGVARGGVRDHGERRCEEALGLHASLHLEGHPIDLQLLHSLLVLLNEHRVRDDGSEL